MGRSTTCYSSKRYTRAAFCALLVTWGAAETPSIASAASVPAAAVASSSSLAPVSRGFPGDATFIPSLYSPSTAERLHASNHLARSADQPQSPPFPYLAFAISHPQEPGSAEILARAGYNAPPSSRHSLAKRKLSVKKEEVLVFPHTIVPASSLLMVLGTMAIAVLDLVYILIAVSTTGISAKSRRIMQERARAKTELRVRGGGPQFVTPNGSRTPSPNAPPVAGNKRFSSTGGRGKAVGPPRRGSLLAQKRATRRSMAYPTYAPGTPGAPIQRSSTIGRGTDLSRARSLKAREEAIRAAENNSKLSPNPRPVRVYDRKAPGAGAVADYLTMGHPLQASDTDLRRYQTDPTSRPSSSGHGAIAPQALADAVRISYVGGGALASGASLPGTTSSEFGSHDGSHASSSRVSSMNSMQYPLIPLGTPGFSNANPGSLPGTPLGGSQNHGTAQPYAPQAPYPARPAMPRQHSAPRPYRPPPPQQMHSVRLSHDSPRMAQGPPRPPPMGSQMGPPMPMGPPLVPGATRVLPSNFGGYGARPPPAALTPGGGGSPALGVAAMVRGGSASSTGSHGGSRMSQDRVRSSYESARPGSSRASGSQHSHASVPHMPGALMQAPLPPQQWQSPPAQYRTSGGPPANIISPRTSQAGLAQPARPLAGSRPGAFPQPPRGPGMQNGSPMR